MAALLTLKTKLKNLTGEEAAPAKKGGKDVGGAKGKEGGAKAKEGGGGKSEQKEKQPEGQQDGVKKKAEPKEDKKG